MFLPSISQPHRDTLTDQVVLVLKQELAAGRWREWLPSERSLRKSLNVSRHTLRAALKRLALEGRLRPMPRRGYRLPMVARSRSRAAKASVCADLGLICPQPLFSMPAFIVQLVDRLREQAAGAGMRLEVHEGRRFARSDPGRLMPLFLRSCPKACWILVMAGERMQRWFMNSGTPAVIYGNAYPGITLPVVGIDYRACIRHAAAHLIGKGHRRIVLVAHDLNRAGEQESAVGYDEAFRAASLTVDPSLILSRPDDDPDALCAQVDRLLRGARRATAFIVCRTHHYATVATHLAMRGLLIPSDVSLICRGDEQFLHFLRPAPAFYRVNAEVLAHALFSHVLRVAGGAPRSGDHRREIPEFVSGRSIASCSGRR